MREMQYNCDLKTLFLANYKILQWLLKNTTPYTLKSPSS